MTVRDDRNGQEKFTHKSIVFARDTFMSGWGKCVAGKSYAGWACRDEHLQKIKEWVESRAEMRSVRIVDSDYAPSGNGDYHIYVVNDTHPALQ